jgi:RNA polymerase sigma factor (TIGR02999 family)
LGERGEITRLFESAARGDDTAFEQVVERVFAELEKLARRQMRDRFGGLEGLTLEPKAIVNETLMKLLPRPPRFVNRRHFFAFASKVMRRVLLDYQKARGRARRGGAALRVTLSDLGAAASTPPETGAVQVGEVLDHLEELDSRKCEVVQLKVFWGLEMSEIAETLEVSLSTVERDWRFSRAWLARELALA